jgi:hypothetical protein
VGSQGRTAEVKLLARELTKVFKSKGVHREALAGLQLFKTAAEREEATAELARRVLGYLFRARHDQGPIGRRRVGRTLPPTRGAPSSGSPPPLPVRPGISAPVLTISSRVGTAGRSRPPAPAQLFPARGGLAGARQTQFPSPGAHSSPGVER